MVICCFFCATLRLQMILAAAVTSTCLLSHCTLLQKEGVLTCQMVEDCVSYLGRGGPGLQPMYQHLSLPVRPPPVLTGAPQPFVMSQRAHLSPPTS